MCVSERKRERGRDAGENTQRDKIQNDKEKKKEMDCSNHTLEKSELVISSVRSLQKGTYSQQR